MNRFKAIRITLALSLGIWAIVHSDLDSTADGAGFIWPVVALLCVLYLVSATAITLLGLFGSPFRRPGMGYDPQSHLRASEASFPPDQGGTPHDS
ncbi:MAG: hypothetical protein ACPGUC_00330 [Gammaproteobacteria bacterium]